MPDLKTDQNLLRTIEKAASSTPTAEEVYKQRISFIMGSVGDDNAVTRARVTEVLAAQEGKK